ncbi:MAG: LLM class flavin-dependent oxidoreductase [Acidimicrobiales bacterium]
MKIRIGFGLGTRTGAVDASPFVELVDALDDLGFDSLWLSERLTEASPDPVVGLAIAAGRSQRLKLGTSVQVLPGRNPVLVAKEWATLDRLSGGRALPAFGLGIADSREQAAFGVERGERAAWFDEALPLVRRLWTGEPVDHDGPRFRLSGVRVRPTPLNERLDVWLGGRARAELRRVGRLGDGWLPSFCTPDDVVAGRAVVEATAAEHGRAIDADHYGALIPYVPTAGPHPDLLVAALAARRPDLADRPGDVPAGLDALRECIGRFVEAGASKFVVVPVVEPEGWTAHLTDVADALLDLHA